MTSRDVFFNFDAHNHLRNGWSDSRQIFYAGRIYIKCLAFDDRLLHNRRGQGHMTHFLKFCTNPIFGIGEARHFKFHVLIDM